MYIYGFIINRTPTKLLRIYDKKKNSVNVDTENIVANNRCLTNNRNESQSNIDGISNYHI